MRRHWRWKVGQQWQARLLWQNDYTYSSGGQRLTNLTTDHNGQQRTETYGYDRLYRLTSVNYGDGEVHNYVHDPMGNRTSKVVNGTPEGYTYDNANRLLTRGGQNYTNDLAGNTLTGGGRSMTWDAQNRMVTCSYGGVTSTFTYGADGLRRRMVVGNNVTDYVLDGQNVVREMKNGQVEAFYLYGPRGPEYRRDAAGNVEWYLFDGLGSVVATVGSSGTVLDTRQYDVYGGVRAGGAGTRHRFVGQLGHTSDGETGLLYMRARYCDPVVGRFVSQDPARDGTNWFAYANCSPTNGADFSGRSFGLMISGIMTFPALSSTLSAMAMSGILFSIAAASYTAAFHVFSGGTVDWNAVMDSADHAFWQGVACAGLGMVIGTTFAAGTVGSFVLGCSPAQFAKLAIYAAGGSIAGAGMKVTWNALSLHGLRLSLAMDSLDEG